MITFLQYRVCLHTIEKRRTACIYKIIVVMLCFLLPTHLVFLRNIFLVFQEPIPTVRKLLFFSPGHKETSEIFDPIL